MKAALSGYRYLIMDIRRRKTADNFIISRNSSVTFHSNVARCFVRICNQFAQTTFFPFLRIAKRGYNNAALQGEQHNSLVTV